MRLYGVSIENRHQDGISRRTLMRRSVLFSTTFGLTVATASSPATAGKKPELIEAMASEAGLTPAAAEAVVDAFTSATTRALADGDSVALPAFGLFSVRKRPGRTKAANVTVSRVAFAPCPELAEALELTPGRHDDRRAAAAYRCGDADVVVDADRIVREVGSKRDGDLSTADATRGLEAFVAVATRTLGSGDVVSLGGFGTFSISKRSARTGRNPQTGKEIQIAAKNVVKFKAGAELSKAVN